MTVLLIAHNFISTFSIISQAESERTSHEVGISVTSCSNSRQVAVTSMGMTTIYLFLRMIMMLMIDQFVIDGDDDGDDGDDDDGDDDDDDD